MLPIARLISDIESNVGRGSGEDHARTLRRITDLFVHGAPAFGPEQVELFDHVIRRFADVIETRARVELAERLAPIANAPRGVIERLASDEIVVARPVLAASPRLDDQALLRISLEKGRDHMLAICERARLSPPVTDVLVREGDGVVRHAVAGNPGARFTPTGIATLIGHARRDEALGALLGDRTDLTPLEAKQLVEIAKEAARQRLRAALPVGSDREIDAAVDRSASGLGVTMARSAFDYASTAGAVAALMQGREIREEDLCDFAEAGRVPEAIAALASLTGLPIVTVERIFEERDNDLLLVIGKARGWHWRTVRQLLRLRDPSLRERHHFRRAEETFDGLATATATRVLHFLKVREASGHAGRPGRQDGLRFG